MTNRPRSYHQKYHKISKCRQVSGPFFSNLPWNVHPSSATILSDLDPPNWSQGRRNGWPRGSWRSGGPCGKEWKWSNWRTRQDETTQQKTSQDQTRREESREEKCREGKSEQKTSREEITTRKETRKLETRPEETRRAKKRQQETRKDKTSQPRPRSRSWRQYWSFVGRTNFLIYTCCSCLRCGKMNQSDI